MTTETGSYILILYDNAIAAPKVQAVASSYGQYKTKRTRIIFYTNTKLTLSSMKAVS